MPKGREKVLSEDDLKEGITLDNCGRMNYHPDFHPNHKQPFSEEDLEYLCKFYDADGPRAISYALGKTEKTCMSRISELRKNGKYEYYRSLNNYV